MTTKPLVPRALALEDVEAALDYYLGEAGAEAATGFVDELRAVYAPIARNPGSGSPRYAHELDIAGLRSWPMKRYPYLIFYFEQSGHVEVWRVLHGKRDIPAWLPDPPTQR
ncbi:MAG: type II toxin-antitoxin system RelE/ParE family toxin [Variovorax sp.]|nr:MAG: type II toxin-antitoxin system RelE/ParE family toxin [Variovorax sp.]